MSDKQLEKKDSIGLLPCNHRKLSIKTLQQTPFGVQTGVAPFTFGNGDKYIGNWHDYKMDGYGLYVYNHIQARQSSKTSQSVSVKQY